MERFPEVTAMVDFNPDYFLYGIYFIFFVVFLFVVVRLVRFLRKRSGSVLARMERIQIHFLRNYKTFEPYLELTYRYKVKHRVYEGSTKIPFSLLTDNINQNMYLYYNEELQMPVLQIQNEVYAGEEAIEHKILEMLPYLPIRYLASDPSRNFVLPFNRYYSSTTKE